MIYHIVQGASNGAKIVETIALGRELQGEVISIADSFSFGPLRDENIPFDQLRAKYWSEIQLAIGQKDSTELHDLTNITKLIQQVNENKEAEIWYWMGTAADDLITYYFLLHYFKKYSTIFKIININGLPFLDDDMKLFYPKSLAEIPLKELNKARKLARLMSASEWEADGDEWKCIVANQSMPIRLYKGGKKLVFMDIDWVKAHVCSHIEQEGIKLAKLLLRLNPSQCGWRQLYYQSIIHSLLQSQEIKLDQHLVKRY